VAVEGRTHKPVLDYGKCETCAVCLQACPAEVVTDMRQEEDSLRGRIYEHSDFTPRLNVSKVFAGPRCQMACPIRQDVRGYMKLIAEGRHREALELVREANPLPSVCGYICHHPCEAACTRGRVDDPLSIRSLKMFVADYDDGHLNPPAREKAKNKKIAIIGTGPAGLSAAHELGKKGYEVEMIELYAEPGGMLAWAIPKFRLPREVLRRDIDYIRKLGVRIRTGITFGRDVTWSDLQKNGIHAVILATGTQRSLKMMIRNEDDFEGSMDCLTFLRRYNEVRDISLGDTVLVVGGGNAALDSARSALRSGAKETAIVYRRSLEQMPADREEVDKALDEGIKIQFLTAPVRMIGEAGKVRGLGCVRTQLREADASGRRRPVPIQGSEFVLHANTVIAAVGQAPDYDLAGPMEMDRESLRTSEEGVFVAGDFVTGPTSVVEAMASGKKAAQAVDRHLSGDGEVHEE
jgi:heterodisulfide reductase subunit A